MSFQPSALSFHRYWTWYFTEPEHPLTEPEYVEELDRLFRQAVNRQLVSDVDVGAYLSGGMDSGSITAIAAQQLPYMKTFTCGFDLHSASGLELGYDEREKAEHMSYLFKTEHYEMVLKAGDMERILPKLAWHLEEPRVGLMMQKMKSGIVATSPIALPPQVAPTMRLKKHTPPNQKAFPFS